MTCLGVATAYQGIMEVIDPTDLTATSQKETPSQKPEFVSLDAGFIVFFICSMPLFDGLFFWHIAIAFVVLNPL